MIKLQYFIPSLMPMRTPPVIKWVLPLGIATTPFLVMQTLMDPGQTIRYLYLSVFGTAMVLFLALTCKERLSQVLPKVVNWKNPILICILIWLVATVVSLGVALQKSEGLVEVARIIFLLTTYLWVFTVVRVDSKNILYLSIGFCLVSMILSVIGLNDLFESLKKASNDGYYQMTGNMGNRNLLAIMISLCLPFYFILFENYKSRYVKIGLTACFAIAATVACLTSSRVGWLGLGAGLFIGIAILIFAGIKGLIQRGLLKKFFVDIAAFIVLLAASFSLLMQNEDASQAISQRLRSFYNFKSDNNIHTESINERLLLWNNSVQLIADHPLTGVGAGNWKFRYPEKSLSGRIAQGNVLYPQPHNDFLWVFSETGVLGGLAFSMLFVIALILAMRSLIRSKLKENKISFAVAFALATGISMYAVHSFFDFPKERPLILFTFACMLALASSLAKAGDKKTSPVKRPWLFVTVYLVVALTGTVIWYNRMQGEIVLKKAMTARLQNNYQKVNAYLDKLDPTFFQSDLTGTPIAWYQGEADYRLGKLKDSQEHFAEAVRLSPYHLMSHYNLGATLYFNGNVAAAIRSWQKALEIAPDFSDAAINLSTAYSLGKEFEKAVVLLAKAEIDYNNKSNLAAVTAAFSGYISILEDSVTHPQLLATFLEMQTTDEYLQSIQYRMRVYNESARVATFKKAIGIAKDKGRITAVEADSLKAFYRLTEKGDRN